MKIYDSAIFSKERQLKNNENFNFWIYLHALNQNNICEEFFIVQIWKFLKSRVI